jgi:hypothetical protein
MTKSTRILKLQLRTTDRIEIIFNANHFNTDIFLFLAPTVFNIVVRRCKNTHAWNAASTVPVTSAVLGAFCNNVIFGFNLYNKIDFGFLLEYL